MKKYKWRKTMSLLLVFTMLLNLMPVLQLTANAAGTSLINIKANYTEGDPPGCKITPTAEAVDNSGNTYAIGNFGNWLSTYNSMSSPLATVDFGGTVLTQSNNSSSTIFITKYNVDGTLAWAKAIGSAKSSSYTYGDCGAGIKVDSSGNVYIVGSFMQDFDLGQDNSFETTGLPSNNNGFLAKLDTDGQFQWVIPIVCPNSGSYATCLDLDSSGNIYFSGTYYHATTVQGQSGSTAMLPEGNGCCNMYVMKVNSSGVIQWSRTGLSTGGDPGVNGIAVSSDGYVYTVGQRCGITVNDITYTSISNYFDGFVMKLSTNNDFEWFKETSGADYDSVTSVCVDSANTPIISGTYSSDTADINPGSTSISPHYAKGAYVAKLGTDGDISWYANVGGSDAIHCVSVDSSNNLYAAGIISGDSIYTSANGSLTSTSGISQFLMKLDSSGTMQWNRQFGNSVLDSMVLGMSFVPTGIRILASVTDDFDVDPGSGTVLARATSVVKNYYVVDWDSYTDINNSAIAIFTLSADGSLTTFGVPNTAPTLTSMDTLTGASEDAAYTIPYDTLKNASNAADIDGDAISFRVEALSSGTLTKGGTAVTPGTTMLSTGESLVWTPEANANGILNAFTVKAYDGSDTSSTAVQVKVSTASVNDVPSGKPTITGSARIGNTLTASASGISDTDGLGIFSYQWQVSGNGTSGWTDILSSATASFYTLTAGEAGKYVRVQVSYTDGDGASEAVYSDAFGPNQTSQAAITYNSVGKTYGDAPFSWTASGGSSSNSFQYSSSDSSIATIDSSTGLVTIKKAGTVTLTASKAGDSTYIDASADCTLTVEKATLTATVANYSKTYGDANPTFTVNVTGFKNGENASTVSGYVAPTAICSATTTTPAGTAAITINTDGSADNYVFNTSGTGTLSINQRQVTLTATAGDKTYNGSTAATGTISVGNTVNGDTVTAVGTFAFDSSNAGSSKTVHVTGITLGGTDAGNYTLDSSTPLTATAIIAKKSLLIKANPVTVYCGQSVSGLTVNVSGFISGETPASLAGFVLPSATPAFPADTSSPVTNADLTVQYIGGNPTDNYQFDYDYQTKLTVEIPAADGHYSVSPTANSEGWYKNTITITPTSGFDRISTDGTTWSSNLTLSSETSNGTIHFMLKNSADGTTTGSKAFDYKLDKTKPNDMTVQVKDSSNRFTSFLNTITFGLCFPNTVSVTLSANDSGSGVAHYEYQLVDTSKGQTYRSDGDWLSTDGSFLVSPQFKGAVYARAIDKAGNVSDVVSSNGFVLDSQMPTAPNVTASADGNSYSGGWTAGNIQLTASGALALCEIDHYEYKIGNSGSWAALPGTGILTVTSDMDDEIHFRAVNKVNTAGPERIVNMKRDSALPHVQVNVSGTTGQWTDQPVVFTLSNTASNLSPVTYWVKIDSADWTQLSGNNLTVSQNTNTTYEFRAVSASGTASLSSGPYTVKIAGVTLKETIDRIDALPNPDTAADKEITDSQQDIKAAKILYDSLQADEKTAVGTERSDKLNNLIYRLNALLVIIPKDPNTKVTADNLGTSVNLSELSDPNVGKVTVNLTANSISLNETSSEQHRNIAIASSAMSGSDKTILAAFDVSLFKTVYDSTGTQISNEKISNTAITAPITIRIPVPEGYANRNDLQVVYIDNAGNVTPFETTVVTVDGIKYLQFTTTHFSVYAVTVSEQKAPVPNPDTGDSSSHFPVDALSLFGLAVLSIFAGSVLCSKRKLIKRKES